MQTEGVIRDAGGKYRDGLNRLEILVPKKRALALPYEEGTGKQILLSIKSKNYRGVLRATQANPDVWFSPVVYDESDQKLSLASVLVNAGFTMNQDVHLTIEGNLITVNNLDQHNLREEPSERSGVPERVFGEITGFPERSTFPSRQALSQASVHRPVQAGISGSQSEGADSIVLSGGYEDDRDEGDEKTPALNAPNRISVLTSRIIRDTRQTRRIKEIYDYRCQICGVRLEGNAGPYAEAAHIKPLGQPHNGPDVLENLLCLCPNHHVLFDYGGITLSEDYSIIGGEGSLIVSPKHRIDLTFIRYHREHYGFDAP